jgi:hypothetical protein
MKLTNNEITLALTTLQKLGQKEMPIKQTYEILKVVKALEPQGVIIEECRKKLIEKYGEDGKIEPNTDGMRNFFEEFNGVLQEEVNLKGVKRFSLPDDISISMQDLYSIDKLVKA